MLDVFEEVKNILDLEYISDLRFYKNKGRIMEIIEGLPDDRFTKKQKQEFTQYIMEKY